MPDHRPTVDRPTLVTAAIAGGALLLGFTAAQVSGLRWAGGAVVVVGALWCVLRERRRTPWWRLALVLVAGAVCFVAAHLLTDPLGPWPAVALVSLLLAGTTTALVRPTRGRPSAVVEKR